MRGSGFPSQGFREKYQVSVRNEKNRPGSPKGLSVEASFGVCEMSGFRTLDSLDDTASWLCRVRIEAQVP